MSFPDLHTAIADLAGLYDELNGCLEKDHCACDVYQVYRQKAYRDLYGKLKEANVESIAIKVVADSLNGKVLSRLRGLIGENIRISEARREAFDSVDFDKLFPLWDDYLFGQKRAILVNDKELITDYPYPSEEERASLLKENRSDFNQLDNERSELRRTDAQWVGKNYYAEFYGLSRSFASIIDSYFPTEKEVPSVIAKEVLEPEELTLSVRSIAPDAIFRTRMFDKFLSLESRLIKDGDLDDNLHWSAKHKNDRPDIRRLVTLLTGLIDNNYFLPNRDSAIKAFFESRYRISIGQNFERKRREPLLAEYRAVFYDYPF